MPTYPAAFRRRRRVRRAAAESPHRAVRLICRVGGRRGSAVGYPVAADRAVNDRQNCRSDISNRIAYHQPHESKAVICTPEAQYINNKESGTGSPGRHGRPGQVQHLLHQWLDVIAGGRRRTNGEAGGPGQQTTRQAARIHRFTAAPVLSRRRRHCTCAGDDAKRSDEE